MVRLTIKLLLVLSIVSASHLHLFAMQASGTDVDGDILKAEEPLHIQIRSNGKILDLAKAISVHNHSGLHGVPLDDVMVFDQSVARYPIQHDWPLTFKLRNSSVIYYCTRLQWRYRITSFQLMNKRDHRPISQRLFDVNSI